MLRGRGSGSAASRAGRTVVQAVSSDWAQRRFRQRALQKYMDNPENLPEEAWSQLTDPLSFGVASALKLLHDRRLPQRRVVVAMLVFIGGAAPALLTLAFPGLDIGNPVVWAVTLFVAGLLTLVPAQVEAVYGRGAGRRARCSLWRIDLYAMMVSLIAFDRPRVHRWPPRVGSRRPVGSWCREPVRLAGPVGLCGPPGGGRNRPAVASRRRPVRRVRIIPAGF